MRVVGVGDNTVDKYIYMGQMFPGGNAVNVAVLAKRLGHQGSYVGCLGNDVYAALLVEALTAEGLDISHCKYMDAPNAHSEVDLVKGDRVFGNSTHGTSAHLVLTDDDFAYIGQHDLTHTSIYSHLETQIEALGKASKTLAFDFSQGWDKPYLEQIAPHIQIALLSAPDKAATTIEELMRWLHDLGPMMVIVTQGKYGAWVFDGMKIYRQGIVETKVVDTLGAGDAFAARFMVEFLSGTPVQESMQRAAETAAQTCGYYGAFGYGRPIPKADA